MLWICGGCTTRYSVGAPRCPHCGSTDYYEQGSEMPKSTKAAGATNKFTDEPTAEPEPTPEPEPVPVKKAAKKATKKATKAKTETVE